MPDPYSNHLRGHTHSKTKINFDNEFAVTAATEVQDRYRASFETPVTQRPREFDAYPLEYESSKPQSECTQVQGLLTKCSYVFPSPRIGISSFCLRLVRMDHTKASCKVIAKAMSDPAFEDSDRLLGLLWRLNLNGETAFPMETLETFVSSRGR